MSNPTPKADIPNVNQADVLAHFHSQSNARHHEQQGPLMITSGDGVWVEDIDGNRYLESMSGLWFASLGFSNSALIEAAYAQMQRLPCYHTFNHRSNDACALLAQELQSILPFDNGKLFFVNSGSEANDTMVKLAWYYHAANGQASRKKILTRKGAFHGSSIFGAALSGLAHMHAGFNLPETSCVITLSEPNYYFNAENNESEADYTDRLVRELEHTILSEGADTIAAMIAEPIMGAGGVVLPPQGYFEKVSALLKKHDILFLVDEVVCGFGRTGEWFGSQTFGLVPDMMGMAKGLSSGYQPIGAVAISDPVYQVVAGQSDSLGTFGHGYTYSGHPVASAVALEAFRQYKAMNAPALVREKGRYLRDKLSILENHPLVGEVRSIGLIAAIELVADKSAHLRFPAELLVGKNLEKQALAVGLIVRNMGDTIALCPPFVISKNEIDQLCQRLKLALDNTHTDISRAA